VTDANGKFPNVDAEDRIVFEVDNGSFVDRRGIEDRRGHFEISFLA
jgi:hypothetical protein